MFERNLGYIFALGIALLGSVIIGWAVWPERAALEKLPYEGARSRNYHAGGTRCESAALAALGRGRNAARERADCVKEAEEHRLQTNDLIQQTRAASAAEAQAKLASQAAWTGFFQTIGGFVTLVAAGAAAIYARDAATETRRAADAANEQVLIAREGQRAWMKADAEIVSLNLHDDKFEYVIRTSLTNIGATVAHSVKVRVNVMAVEPRYFKTLDSIFTQWRDEMSHDEGVSVLPGDVEGFRTNGSIGFSHPFVYHKPNGRRLRVAVLLYCSYCVPGEKVTRHTQRAWILRRNADWHRAALPIDDMGSFSRDHAALDPAGRYSVS